MYTVMKCFTGALQMGGQSEDRDLTFEALLNQEYNLRRGLRTALIYFSSL